MNKNILKKILVVLGAIFVLINFAINYIAEEGEILEAIFAMGFKSFEESSVAEIILTILAILCFAIALLMKDEKTISNKENIKCKEKSPEQMITKYKIWRVIGCLPFIGILSAAIYAAIEGVGFITTTIYGFEAFIMTIIVCSITLWPAYLIGIFLIVRSSIKIDKLKGQK